MSILKFKKANCKNCYKCVRNCPVKAIEVKDHQAQIIEQNCILCGKCMQVCPQNAKVVRCDTAAVAALIAQGKRVIASVAPSYIAGFPVIGFSAFSAALKALGFSDAFETAEGAYLVKSRYEALVDEQWSNVIISSSCSTVVQMIQTHYPAALPHLAPVLSPMQAHAKLILQQHPDASVVFIGPCVSKKDECERYSDPSELALTFDELTDWMAEKKIGFPAGSEPSSQAYLSRFFPTNGGILKTMRKAEGYRYLSVDGAENCADVLSEICEGTLENCFVEMSACAGSCINGPGATRKQPSLLASQMQVEKLATDGGSVQDYNPQAAFSLDKTIPSRYIAVSMPNEQQLSVILRRMGKHHPEDELNCGTCGYSTCREKAVAVYFGKAEISMCLPFMMERAESITFKIIDTVPNAIITVNTDMNIQQINHAACDIFGVSDTADVIDSPVSRLMNEYDFVKAVTSDSGKISQRVYLAEYEKYLEQEFRYDKSSGMILCVMKDVTREEVEREKLISTKLSAASITDKIIEKQLRIVHEIASLLGETAAETQIALTDLKNTILLEERKP